MRRATVFDRLSILYAQLVQTSRVPASEAVPRSRLRTMDEEREISVLRVVGVPCGMFSPLILTVGCFRVGAPIIFRHFSSTLS